MWYKGSISKWSLSSWLFPGCIKQKGSFAKFSTDSGDIEDYPSRSFGMIAVRNTHGSLTNCDWLPDLKQVSNAKSVDCILEKGTGTSGCLEWRKK